MYYLQIVPKIQLLIKAIESSGKPFQDTKEILGAFLSLNLANAEFDREVISVASLMGTEKFVAKQEQEVDHYKMLSYGLKHRVKEVMYFNKCGPENRKVVFFSNDCISMIQYLVRGKTAMMLVHMRSSDVRGLLPVDTLNLVQIFLALNKLYCPEPEVATLDIVIGSAHLYNKGERDS